jgi:putative IMPACT (imprinted ancient) family translation regulator
LIAAYKESAAAVLDEAIIEERTVDKRIKIDFSYIVMNDVMRIIKEEQPKIEEQVFDNLCSMTLAMRLNKADILLGRLKKVEGAIVEVLE